MEVFFCVEILADWASMMRPKIVQEWAAVGWQSEDWKSVPGFWAEVHGRCGEGVTSE